MYSAHQVLLEPIWFIKFIQYLYFQQAVNLWQRHCVCLYLCVEFKIDLGGKIPRLSCSPYCLSMKGNTGYMCKHTTFSLAPSCNLCVFNQNVLLICLSLSLSLSIVVVLCLFSPKSQIYFLSPSMFMGLCKHNKLNVHLCRSGQDRGCDSVCDFEMVVSVLKGHVIVAFWQVASLGVTIFEMMGHGV